MNAVDRISIDPNVRFGKPCVHGTRITVLGDYVGGFGASCKVLRPGPDVDPAYFAHFFRTREYRRRVSALAAGVNINNLRNEHLDEMQVPLPALPEQRRIAAILDKADALRAKRRAALAQLEALIRITSSESVSLLRPWTRTTPVNT